MRKCCGNNTREWGPDAIFTVACPHCGHQVEFFQDEITRSCPACHRNVPSSRSDFGCGQWCSSSSTHTRYFCPKFKRSKDRYNGYWTS